MITPLVGHETPKAFFTGALRRGRLASTYLFVGPDGVGKRLFAERLAAALVCQRNDGRAVDPCGACDACRLSASGSHPDVLRVSKPEDRATLPIDAFIGPADKRNQQGLCHDLSLRPMLADRRVAIIDDADAFSIETANCLLKTLEEPPPRSLILLIGTSLSRQIATIRSRSQVIRFAPLTDQQVAAVLSGAPHALEPKAAQRLAEMSGGSVSRALLLTEESFVAARQELLHALESGGSDPIALMRLIEERSKAAGTEPKVRRRLLRELIDGAVGHFHRRLVEGANEERRDGRLDALDACLRAEEQTGRNGNQSAVVQSLAERLATIDA